MKKLLLCAAASAALMVMAAPAFAQSTFDGGYAGAAGGYATSSVELSDADGNVPGVIELGANGLEGTAFAGYGATFDSFYVGIEGAVGYGDINHKSDLGGMDIQGSSNETAAIYGRLGYAITESTLLYTVAGLSYTSWDFKDGNTEETRGVTSYRLGLGAEHEINDGMFTRVGFALDIPRDGVRVNDANIEPTTETVSFGVGFRF